MVRALRYSLVRCTLYSSRLAKMWELNDNLNVITITIDGSPAYIIDDFYKDPDTVARWLFCRNTPLWKNQEIGTRNGTDFEDKRIDIRYPRQPLHDFLENLCGQQVVSNEEAIITNQHRFLRNSYNEKYKTHHWWAHCDLGYNGIIYFNKDDDVNGTNLYDKNTWKFVPINESVEPWQPKSYTKVVHTFEPKYNRFVFFDGVKFPHGMAINDDRYHCDNFKNAHWSTYRSNQVLFFEPKCGN